jgi:hypothetical protein
VRQVHRKSHSPVVRLPWAIPPRTSDRRRSDDTGKCYYSDCREIDPYPRRWVHERCYVRYIVEDSFAQIVVAHQLLKNPTATAEQIQRSLAASGHHYPSGAVKQIRLGKASEG